MTIKILVVKPEREPVVREIDGCLETMQRVVDGYIQALYPFEDEVALVCNEEGRLRGLPLNRALRDENGNAYDIVSGTFFICSAPVDSESFESLSDEQIAKYEELFHAPEAFIRVDGKIVCLSLPEGEEK